jgi:hypothetical protein
MKKLFQRKGKRTRYNAIHPKTGAMATCVKVGFVYTFADGSTAYSWDVRGLVRSEYITPATHQNRHLD